MWGQQEEAGQDPLPELLDQVPVAEFRVDPPVRGDGAEIDDPDVPARRPRPLAAVKTWR